MKSRGIAPIILVLAALVMAGCRGPSRDDKITARDDTSFDLWLSDHRDVLSPSDVKELNTARQQIRYKTMQSRPGMMSADFANVVYAEINGKTLHELLITSTQLQIERMKTELLNYQPQLQRFQEHDANTHLTDDQKQTVKESLDKLHRLMAEHQEELARLTKRLSELEQEAAAGKK